MKLTDYELISHGDMYPDYFQGCGVSYTSFENVVTGCGSTEKEAFEDALEQIAMDGVTISPELESEGERADSERESEEECYFYVSVRYNVESADSQK